MSRVKVLASALLTIMALAACKQNSEDESSIDELKGLGYIQ